MLRAVVGGQTYDAVAAVHGITRTAVERRIKSIALAIATSNGIRGLNADGVTSVRRLRMHGDAVLGALSTLVPRGPDSERRIPILNADEVASGAARIRVRSAQPLEDIALYYLLLATGARPLEIARLEVRDYLQADGAVRACSVLRPEVAINGRARPLLFRSQHLVDALDAYLADRIARGLGLGGPHEADYRGLAPASRLFLSASGTGFEISPYGAEGQRRFRCRAIQEVFRKMFHHAGLKQVTALNVRHTVADWLYARGADETQVGLLLGIADRSAVREQFPRRPPSLEALTDDLV
jgi:integrase